jgi:hypothetical protein
MNRKEVRISKYNSRMGEITHVLFPPNTVFIDGATNERYDTFVFNNRKDEVAIITHIL